MLFDPKLLALIARHGGSGGSLRGLAEAVLDYVGVGEVVVNGVVPREGPVLLIANHEGVFGSLVLHAVVPRQDFYFVALATYGVLGEVVEQKLVPIYRERRWHHRIFEHPLCLHAKGEVVERLTLEERRARNRVSIARAARLIDEGKMVSIFPMGDVGRTMSGSKWRAGVGYLVKHVTNPEAKVVFVRITGTRQSDIVAYMRPTLRKLAFRPRGVTVTFGEVRRLEMVVDGHGDPKAVARELEAAYGNWVIA